MVFTFRVVSPGTGSGARRQRARGTIRAIVALGVSAALNSALLVALGAAGAFLVQRPPERAPAPVGLAAVSGERWRANRAIGGERPEPVEARPDVQAAPALPEPGGEVVAAPPARDPRPPVRWRFLSDHDGSAPRDVQSREAGKRRFETPLARPIPGAGGAQGVPERGDEGSAAEAAPGREGSRTPDPHDGAVARARRALAPGADGEGGLVGAVAGSRPGARRPGDGGARRAGRYDPRLLPTAATFERLGGGPGERLSGVDEGDETALNTRRFRFAEFFLRVKSAVAREWDPNRAMDARDPGAQRFGRGTRGATVDIVLDPGGRVEDVRVVRGSGLDFYDREVVRAVRAASPFPNPPRALVGEDGRILLARWRFELAWDAPRLDLPASPARRSAAERSGE